MARIINILIILCLAGKILFAIEATQLVITNTLIGTAGAPIKVVVQAQDDTGQLAAQYATGVTFGVIGSSTGKFYPTASDASNDINEITGQVNLVDGELTVWYKDTEANDPDPQITVTDTDGVAPLLRAATNNVIINAAAPEHLTILNLPLSGTAGSPILIKIEARDIYNNRRTTESGSANFSTTHLSTGSFYSTLSDATNQTNSITIKNFTSGTLEVYYVDTDADPEPQISISCLGYTGINNQIVTINPAEAVKLVLTNSILAGTAGEGISLTVVAEDIYGNLVSDDTTSIKLQSSNPTGNFYSNSSCIPGEEITNINLTSGEITVYYKDTEADDPDPSITITDDDGPPVLSGITNFPVTINPGPVYSINILTTETNVSAATNYRTIIAEVKDEYGNKVANGTKIYWSYIDQSPSNQGTAQAFSGVSETSNYTYNGLVTNIFYVSTKQGDDYVIKIGNYKSPNETVYDTIRLIVVPGPPALLVASPLTLTTLPDTNIIISVNLYDTASNVINGSVIYFSNNNPYGNLSEKSNYTDLNGETSSVLTIGNYDDQIYNVIVKDSTGLSCVCTYTANSGAPYSIDLIPSSSSVPTGSDKVLTATVKDINDRVVKGVIVYFNTDFGTVTPLSNYTGADGKATTTLTTITNEDNKTHTVTASINSPSTNDTALITTDSGLPAYLIIEPVSNTVAPNGTTSITVIAKNSSGYPVGNAIINFSCINGTLDKYNETTDNLGYVTVHLTTENKDNLVHYVIADNANTSSVTSYITTEAGPPANMIVTLSTTTIYPGGTVNCEVLVTDTNNAPVYNVFVEFEIDGGGIVDPVSGNTGFDGKISAIITTAEIDNFIHNFRVKIPGVGTNNYNITNKAGSAANLYPVPESTTVGINTTVQIQGKVTDTNNAPVGNVWVKFTTDKGYFGTPGITVVSNLTGNDGIAIANLTTSTLDNDLHTVTISSFGSNVYSYITTDGGIASIMYFTPVLSTNTPGSNQNLILTILDASNRPVVGESVVFTADYGTLIDDDETNIVINGLSDEQGKINLSLQLSTYEGWEHHIVAQHANISSVTSIVVSKSSFYVTPTGIHTNRPGEPETITVTIPNVQGQLIRFFIASDTNGTYDPYAYGTLNGGSDEVYVYTDTNGNASVTLNTIDEDEIMHYVGIARNGILEYTVRVFTKALIPNHIHITPYSNNVARGGWAYFTIVLHDTNNNPINGEPIELSTDKGSFFSNTGPTIFTQVTPNDGEFGVYLYTVTNAPPQLHTLTVKVINYPTILSNAKVVTVGGAYRMTMTNITSYTVRPGEPVTFKATVYDYTNGVVSNEVVGFEVAYPGGGILNVTSATTGSDGTATVIYTTPNIELNRDNEVRWVRVTHPTVNYAQDWVTTQSTGSNLDFGFPSWIDTRILPGTWHNIDITAVTDENGDPWDNQIIQIYVDSSEGYLDETLRTTEQDGTFYNGWPNYYIRFGSVDKDDSVARIHFIYTNRDTLLTLKTNTLYITNDSGAPNNIVINPSFTTIKPNSNQNIYIQLNKITNGNIYPCGNETLTFEVNYGSLNTSSTTTDPYGNTVVTFTAPNLDDVTNIIKIIHPILGTNYAYIICNSEPPNSYFISPTMVTNPPGTNQVFTVTVLDPVGAPVANEAVFFTTTSGSLNANQVWTGPNGQCNVIFTAPNLDSVMSRISAKIVNFSNIYATNYTKSGPIANIWMNPTNDTVLPGNTKQIVAKLVDNGGHPIYNQQIRFTTDYGVFQSTLTKELTNTTKKDGTVTVVLIAENLDRQVHTITATSILSNKSNVSKITTDRGNGALSVMESFPTNIITIPDNVVYITTYIEDINSYPCFGEKIVYEADKGIFIGNNGTKITNQTGVDGKVTVGFKTIAQDGILHYIKIYHLTDTSLGTNIITVINDAGYPAQLNIISVSANPTKPGNSVNIVVKVGDSFNNGVENEDVFFDTDYGTVVPANTTTDSNGYAYATLYTLDLDDTIHHFIASHSFLTSATTNILTDAGPANSISIYTGNNQIGTVKQQLPVQLKVRVVDSSNNPVKNETVIFKFKGNSYEGEFSSTNVLTGADGIAGTYLTLGTKATTYTIIASNVLVGTTIFTEIAEPSYAHHYVVTPINSTNISVDIGQIPINIQLYDLYNNKKPQSISISVTVNNGGKFQNGSSTTNGYTDSNGQFNLILYTSTNSGIVHYVNASSPGNILGQSAAITTVYGSPVRFLVFPSSNTNVEAGDTVNITAALVDQYQNTVVTDGISVNFSVNAGGTVNPSVDITTNGMVETVLVASTNINVTNIVKVWNTSISTDYSGNIIVKAGPPNKIILSPYFLATNISAATNYVIFVANIQDKYGNPVVDSTVVKWGQIGDSGWEFSKTNTTPVNGIVTNIFYTSTVASNTHQVTVTAGTASTQSGIMTVIPGPPTHLRIYPQNSTNVSATAGTLQLVAQVCDEFYNPRKESGYTIYWEVVSNSGVTGILNNGLTKYTNITDTNGQAIANLTVSTVAGDYHYVEVDATTLTNDLSGKIIVGPGKPDKIYFDNITFNTHISADIHEFNYQLTIKDRYGNLVSNNTAITLRWIDPAPANTGSGAQFVPGGLTAIRYTSNGHINVLLNTSEREGDDYILVASAEGDSNITKATCNYRVIVTNGTAHHYMVLIRTNQTVITNVNADYNDKNIVQAQLVDQFNNTVEEAGHIVTFTDISTNNGTFDDGDSGGWEITGTNSTSALGIATNKFRTSIKAGNIHIIRASSDGGTLVGDSYEILVVPGKTVKLIMEFPGTNDYYVSADNRRVPIRVHTADTNNNFTSASGIGIIWTIISNSGIPGYFAENGLSKYTNETISGIAVATLVYSTNAYDYHIIEADETNFGWIPPNSPVSTGKIIVNPGAPAIIDYINLSTDTNIPADNNTINIKIKVWDQFGNIVTNGNQFSWHYIDPNNNNIGIPGGFSTNITTITNGQGETEVFFTTSTVMSDDYWLVPVSLVSGASNLSPKIIVDHGAPHFLGVTVYTNGVVTTNVSVDTLNANIVVQIYDAYTNKVDTPGTDYSPYKIYFSINSNGTLSSPTNWTDTTGKATNLLTVWTNVTTHTITVANSNISTNYIRIHSIPGVPKVVSFITPANTTNLSADIAQINAEIEVKDKYGNLVLPWEVHWSYITNVNNTGSTNQGYNKKAKYTNYTTNGHSIALFSTSTVLSDEYQLVAEVNLTFATSAIIRVDHGTASKFIVRLSKTNVSADTNWTTVYAQYADQFGNPVDVITPITVNFSDISNGIFQQNPVNTDLSGLAVTIMTTSKVAGTIHKITAKYSNINGTSTNILVVPGKPYIFAIYHSTNAIVNQPFDITIRIKDKWNNFTTSYTGQIKITHTGSTNVSLVSNTIITNSYKVIQMTDTKAESFKVIVADPLSNILSATSATIVVYPDTATKFVIKHDGYGIAGINENFEVKATDDFNNCYIYFTGTITISVSEGTLSTINWNLVKGEGVFLNNNPLPGYATYTFVSNDMGVITLSINDTTSESINIHIQQASITDDNSDGKLFIDHNVANNISIYTSWHKQVARVRTNLPNPLGIVVKDIYGNLVDGTNINFSIFSYPVNATGMALEKSSALSETDGIAKVYFTNGTKVGIYIIQATANLNGSPLYLTNYATAGELNFFTITHDGFAAVKKYEPITITLYDKYTNIVDYATNTIALDTDSALINGIGWTNILGKGILNDGGAGTDTATYKFSTNDNGTVELRIIQTNVDAFKITGNIAGIGTISSATLYWRGASFELLSVYATNEKVAQGATNIIVTIKVYNPGINTAKVTNITLIFTDESNNNRNLDYNVILSPTNPTNINSESTQTFVLYIDVDNNAKIGKIIIDGLIEGIDTGSSLYIADTYALTNDSWIVLGQFLNITNWLITPLQIEKNHTLTLSFEIHYSDNSLFTEGVTADWIKIYSYENNNITSHFNINTPQFDGTKWNVNITPLSTAPAGKNNYFSVSGTYQTFTLQPESSYAELGNSGYFEIIQSTLILKYINLSKKVLRINETLKVSFNLYLSDGTTSVSQGVTKTHIRIYNYKGENVTTKFEIGKPEYKGSHWEFTIRATANSPNEWGYYIGIGGRINGDILSEKYSWQDLGDFGRFNVITKNFAYPNFPNPFNPKKGPTTIRFDVLNPNDKVNIKIYTKSGVLVRELNEGEEIQNKYEVKWDGKNDAGNIVASGVYYCVIQIGDYTQINIICVVK